MTARRMALDTAVSWLRLARNRLRAGQLDWAVTFRVEAAEALGLGLGASRHFQRTAGLRRLLDDFDRRLAAKLSTTPQVDIGEQPPALAERETVPCSKQRGQA